MFDLKLLKQDSGYSGNYIEFVFIHWLDLLEPTALKTPSEKNNKS